MSIKRASATPCASRALGAVLVRWRWFLSSRLLAKAGGAAIANSTKRRSDKLRQRCRKRAGRTGSRRRVIGSNRDRKRRLVHRLTNNEPAISGLDQIQGLAAGHSQGIGLVVLAELGNGLIAIHAHSEVVKFECDFGFSANALAALGFPGAAAGIAGWVKFFAIGGQVALHVFGCPGAGPCAHGRFGVLACIG